MRKKPETDPAVAQEVATEPPVPVPAATSMDDLRRQHTEATAHLAELKKIEPRPLEAIAEQKRVIAALADAIAQAETTHVSTE